MRKLYEIYCKHCEEQEIKPVDFINWAGLIFLLDEQERSKRKGYRNTCEFIISRALCIPKEELKELNFDPFQDAAGILFRNKYLNNNNELISPFNKLLNFLV